MTALDYRDWDLEVTTYDDPIPLTPYELDRLDGEIGDNFRYQALPDGSIEIDCSGCDTHVVDDIDAALALITHHRQLHDQENRP